MQRAGISVAKLAASIGLVGLLVAAATAIGSFVMVSGTGSPGAATPAAARLLAQIANAAEQQSSPQVRDSEFMYIRSEVAFASYTNGSQTPTMDKLHERQVWLPVANVCVTGLLIEEGERTPLSPYPVVNGKVVPPSPGEPSVTCGKGTVNGPTYRLLQSLPTDPRALLNLIYADTRGDGQAAAEPEKQKTVRREAPKVGRNEPCPCGSGKKYKKCHGATAVA